MPYTDFRTPTQICPTFISLKLKQPLVTLHGQVSELIGGQVTPLRSLHKRNRSRLVHVTRKQYGNRHGDSAEGLKRVSRVRSFPDSLTTLPNADEKSRQRSACPLQDYCSASHPDPGPHTWPRQLPLRLRSSTESIPATIAPTLKQPA